MDTRDYPYWCGRFIGFLTWAEDKLANKVYDPIMANRIAMLLEEYEKQVTSLKNDPRTGEEEKE